MAIIELQTICIPSNTYPIASRKLKACWLSVRATSSCYCHL